MDERKTMAYRTYESPVAWSMVAANRKIFADYLFVASAGCLWAVVFIGMTGRFCRTIEDRYV